MYYQLNYQGNLHIHTYLALLNDLFFSKNDNHHKFYPIQEKYKSKKRTFLVPRNMYSMYHSDNEKGHR